MKVRTRQKEVPLYITPPILEELGKDHFSVIEGEPIDYKKALKHTRIIKNS